MKADNTGFETVKWSETRRIAVLADGENLSANSIRDLMARIDDLGTATILRAYCDRLNPNGWDKDHRFQVTYLDTQSGKNSADIRLVIDAMDIAYAAEVDVFVILSTDRDFAPLAHRLRNVGYWVLGAGRPETSRQFQSACSEFHVLIQQVAQKVVATPGVAAAPVIIRAPCAKPDAKPQDKIDILLHRIIRNEGNKGEFPIVKINAAIRNLSPDFRIASTPEKTWRAYLTKRAVLYACDTNGPEAKVRLKTP
ncbi:MAG: NYN domain-containing protein [Paracoccaceae bacterium]|nr:NYN domain-containing protein [Paracoccaceae bacterium]